MKILVVILVGISLGMVVARLPDFTIQQTKEGNSPLKVLVKNDTSPLEIKLMVKEAELLLDLCKAEIETIKTRISLRSKELDRASDRLDRAYKLRNARISGVSTINESDYLDYLMSKDKATLNLATAKSKLLELETKYKILEHHVVLCEHGFFRHR